MVRPNLKIIILSILANYPANVREQIDPPGIQIKPILKDGRETGVDNLIEEILYHNYPM